MDTGFDLGTIESLQQCELPTQSTRLSCAKSTLDDIEELASKTSHDSTEETRSAVVSAALATYFGYLRLPVIQSVYSLLTAPCQARIDCSL